MKKFVAPAVAVVLWCSSGVVFGAEKGKPRESADQRVARTGKSKANARSAATVTPSPNVISEVLGKGFSIPNNGSQTFDATSDFTGAEQVAISVKAASGSDIANEGFQIWVYWATPEVDFYAANEVITGDTFNFYIQGGGVVPVYGPELRLVVQNVTGATVNFDQFTVYAVRKATAVTATPVTPTSAQ